MVALSRRPSDFTTPPAGKRREEFHAEGEAEIVAAQALKGRLVPEDVAAMVLFRASDDARLITGHVYLVDAVALK